MNSKKLLFGSLSLVFGLFGMNVAGAIAQVSGRYLSDQEIESLETDFQSAALGSSRVRAYTDIRSSSEISQFNDFVNAWAKTDSSIAPFLGAWQGWEESYSFYPSKTKGQICAVLTFYDGRGVKYKVDVGQVSGNKLLIDGDFGKATFIRRKGGVLRKQAGVSVPDQKTDIVAQYNTVGGKKLVFTYIFPTRLQGIRDNRFEKLGCTTSFPSISNTIPSVPTSSTPVKQTNTIARHPTNDDFEKVDRTLQGSRNPERPFKKQLKT